MNTDLNKEKSVFISSERPNEIWLGHRNEPNQILYKDPGVVSEAARAYISYPGGHNEGYADSFKQCFKAFYSHLVAGDFSTPKPFPLVAKKIPSGNGRAR